MSRAGRVRRAFLISVEILGPEATARLFDEAIGAPRRSGFHRAARQRIRFTDEPPVPEDPEYRISRAAHRYPIN